LDTTRDETHRLTTSFPFPSVIQRQLHLMSAHNISKAHAYDIARREYYSARHIDAVETRVAREEAMSYGAYFGKSAIEISQGLEDAQFENWKTWALAQVERERQIAGSAYSGQVAEEDVSEKVADPVFEAISDVPTEAVAP
jgi:small subunit ribosomal protein S23